MENAEKSRLFLFSHEDVLLLLQYRIELNPMFCERGMAVQGWKTIASRLNNGCSEQHVAKKFSNLINMHNKYKAMLKENPDMEINWPFFNVVKEAIRMLNSLKTGESQIDFDHYESSEDDKGSDMDQNGEDEAKNENKENDHINVFESRIKEEIIGDEDADSDHHAAANLSQHRAWSKEMVLKFIQLRGNKYARYFDSKDKTVSSRGWCKIRADVDFAGIGEKQMRKKWQNMVHRYKCIHESFQRGQQKSNDISWQFYEPLGQVLAKRKGQPMSRARNSRKSTNPADSSQDCTTNSPSLSPSHLDVDTVAISLGKQMLNQSSQRITRGAYVKGKYANMMKGVVDLEDSIDDDEIKDGAKKKFDSNHDSHSWTSILAYERERDRVLLGQNNNMLKMMKSLLEKQGVQVPYEVAVDFSHI